MYVQLDEAAEAEYERLLAAEVNEEVKIMEMTWSQSLLAEGMEKGMEKGRLEGMEKGLEKGRLEGTRAVVLGLLERRFGPLAPSLRGKVERMTSSDELSRLASRLLDAQSVEDLDL